MDYTIKYINILFYYSHIYYTSHFFSENNFDTFLLLFQCFQNYILNIGHYNLQCILHFHLIDVNTSTTNHCSLWIYPKKE